MEFGTGEVLIVLAVALIVLGPGRLPKLARSLGEAIHELRAGTHEGDEARDPSQPVDG